MAMNLLSLEEYDNQLLEKFNNLTSEDFESLIQLAISTLSVDGNSIPINERQNFLFIVQVVKYCKDNRTMSFKQWKAINVFIKQQTRNQTTKQF